MYSQRSYSGRGAQDFKKAVGYLHSHLFYCYDVTNKVPSRKSDIPLKICLPSTRAAYFTLCPIKETTRLKQPHSLGAGRQKSRCIVTVSDGVEWLCSLWHGEEGTKKSWHITSFHDFHELKPNSSWWFEYIYKDTKNTECVVTL